MYINNEKVAITTEKCPNIQCLQNTLNTIISVKFSHNTILIKIWIEKMNVFRSSSYCH